MKALILFGVSVVLSPGTALANPEPLSGAQNISDCKSGVFITFAWKHPAAWRPLTRGNVRAAGYLNFGTGNRAE